MQIQNDESYGVDNEESIQNNEGEEQENPFQDLPDSFSEGTVETANEDEIEYQINGNNKIVFAGSIPKLLELLIDDKRRGSITFSSSSSFFLF
jgi:hypothetical protein